MMTREKPNSTDRRVIINLSFPHGTSVNSGETKDKYLGTPFMLKFPTIDTVTDQIKALGRGCMIYKVNISHAFRHNKLDPMDYDLLGLRHDHHYLPAFWVQKWQRNFSAHKRCSASYIASASL